MEWLKRFKVGIHLVVKTNLDCHPIIIKIYIYNALGEASIFDYVLSSVRVPAPGAVIRRPENTNMFDRIGQKMTEENDTVVSTEYGIHRPFM